MAKAPRDSGMGGEVVESKLKKSILTNAWWTAPKKDKETDPNGKRLAQHITRVATKLETANYQDRWRTLVFYRHFFGRPTTSQFAYGMAKRPTSFVNYFSQFEYEAPLFNLMAECGDVYTNRMFRNKTFVEVVPERGQFNQRQASKALTEWVDAEFDALKFWDLHVRMGIDAQYAGSGVIKTWPDFIGKKPTLALVSKDELLLENPDDPDPQSIIQRVWASREDLLDVFGSDPAAAKAICDAPSAFPAFFFGPGLLDTANVVPLLAGWRVNHVTGKKGRYALVVGDYTLADDVYDDSELPFDKWDFHQVAGAYWGQGLAEILLGINDSLNQHLKDMEECLHRTAWPHWLVEENSGVNEAALGDSPASIVKYLGTKPEMIAPPPYPKDLPEQVQALIKLGKERAHISENAVKGEMPGSLQSAVAISRYAQVDDANFAEMVGRLDAFVLKVATRLIKLGIKLKPPTNLPGYRKNLVNWKAVEQAFNDRPISLKCFGVNRLSQEPAQRQQQLDAMLANGEIKRSTYTRVSQTPDVDGMLDMINAPQDAVDKMLDRIVQQDEYEPPTPFMDLDFAKERSEQRYLFELDLGSPRSTLDLLLQWRAAVLDLKEQLITPPKIPALPDTGLPTGAPATPPVPPAEGMPSPGFGGPDTAALAPSPSQIAPALPPPVLP